MNPKREKCAAAGRYVRQIQREHLREVAGEMKEALEALLSGVAPTFWTDHRDVEAARTALEKARRLGL